MKKYTQIFAVLIVFTLLVIAKQGLSSNGNINLGVGDDDHQAVVAPSALPLPSPVTTVQGQYRDGTYTGSVADAYYGYVQVQAIVSGGKLTNVVFLQHPSDNRTSQNINNQAMPYLTQEAIQAQSAKVNTISGASATSGAFIQSLQAALKQAV